MPEESRRPGRRGRGGQGPLVHPAQIALRTQPPRSRSHAHACCPVWPAKAQPLFPLRWTHGSENRVVRTWATHVQRAALSTTAGGPRRCPPGGGWPGVPSRSLGPGGLPRAPASRSTGLPVHSRCPGRSGTAACPRDGVSGWLCGTRGSSLQPGFGEPLDSWEGAGGPGPGELSPQGSCTHRPSSSPHPSQGTTLASRSSRALRLGCRAGGVARPHPWTLGRNRGGQERPPPGLVPLGCGKGCGVHRVLCVVGRVSSEHPVRRSRERPTGPKQLRTAAA